MASGTGSVIGGRFRLIEVLGQGGMGRVWRGRDEFLDRDVAIKEVRLSAGLPAEERLAPAARTIREARSAGRLNHPGVVTIHDVIDHDGAPWIVMEYVPGPSLGALVAASGPLPWRQAAQIGAKIADALAHAHAAGIVHRDLKPDNVLVAGDRVVITDFGIARITDSASRLTSTGTVVGTPHFMAPEQLEGSQAGPSADMWSFGATLYAVVEGKPPFDGPTLTAVITAILTRAPVPPRQAGQLGGLITQLLSKDPAGRPAAAVAAQLLRDPPAPAPPVPPALAPPGREKPVSDTVSTGRASPRPAFPPAAPAAPTAPSAPSVPPAGPARRRRSLYLAGGAVAAVVITVISLVVALPGGNGAAGDPGSGPAGATLARVTGQVTGVPASVTDKVAGGAVAARDFVSAPTSVAVQNAADSLGSYFAAVGGQPLTSGGKPEVLYLGAEYCPYCGTESWAIINALSRFGTFTGLRTIDSSSTDAYPDTPSYAFYGSGYVSRYISFTSVEETASYRQGHSASTSVPYAKLQAPTPAQNALLKAYDPQEAIPFVALGGRYVQVGDLAALTPQLLAGKTWAQVAAAMNKPSTAIAQAELGSANYLTAAVCTLTGNAPATACTSVIRSLERTL